MATAEGVFPKIGNDPIYASEINTLYGINRLKGITPILPVAKNYGGGFGTTVAWSTDPTNLGNTTDEDISSATGVGSLITGAGTIFSSMEWDLGDNFFRTYLWVKADFTEDNLGTLEFIGSEDGSTWFSLGVQVQSNVNYNQQVLINPIKFRHIAMIISVSLAGGSESTLKVYEAVCY